MQHSEVISLLFVSCFFSQL